MPDDEQQAIRDKIDELQIEHRDLNEIIDRLSEHPTIDQLLLRRLKKRKLLLKDIISKLESQLIPDIGA